MPDSIAAIIEEVSAVLRKHGASDPHTFAEIGRAIFGELPEDPARETKLRELIDRAARYGAGIDCSVCPADGDTCPKDLEAQTIGANECRAKLLETFGLAPE